MSLSGLEFPSELFGGALKSRLLIPEVAQTSLMDRGPGRASLKAML